jgi:hypothetical protein
VTETKDQPGTDVATVIGQEALNLFAAMAAGIPETAGEDAYDEILTQILSAGSVPELNAPWDTHKAEQLEGHRLRIDSIKRSASDFADGLGMYLVCKGVNLTSGEKITVTLGAISVVAQLAKVHYLDGFPLLCRIVIAERPTKRGYRPIHLNIIALRTSE